MPKRFDGADTVDTATHLLHRLQADGMAVKEVDWKMQYEKVGKTRLPVAARIVIDLVPVQPK